MKATKTIPALLGAVLMLVGGGGMAAGKKSEAKACANFAKFDSAVSAAEKAAPTATAPEIKSMVKNIDKTYADLEKSAPSSVKSDTESLKKTIKDLDKTASKLPKNVPPEEAHATIAPDLEQLKMRTQQLGSKLNCAMGGAGKQGMEQPGQMGGSQQEDMGGSQQEDMGSPQQGGMDQGSEQEQYPSTNP